MKVQEGDVCLFYNPRVGDKPAEEEIAILSYRNSSNTYVTRDGRFYDRAILMISNYSYDLKKKQIRGEV